MMDNIFQDIEPAIDSLMESAKEYYSPSEDIVGDVGIKVFIELIPAIREQVFFDPGGALNYLDEYKEECRRKYRDAEKNSTNNTPEFDEAAFCQSQDDKFFYGVLIKIIDLIASTIRSSKAVDNVVMAETTGAERPKSISSKYYVLAYILDLDVRGETRPQSVRGEVEKVGNSFKRPNFSGHTFYHGYNDTYKNNVDKNSNISLCEYFGDDWRSVVQEIFKEQSSNTDSPIKSKWDEVDKYLRDKGL